MKIKFDNHYGTMELENTIRSIFDRNIAGQIAEDGEYYCIHVDHKTHKMYALSRETEMQIKTIGYPLQEDEVAEFNGEKVRGMSYSEEESWNMDTLMAHVDLWGNIAIDEPFDFEWYLEHCI